MFGREVQRGPHVQSAPRHHRQHMKQQQQSQQHVLGSSQEAEGGNS